MYSTQYTMCCNAVVNKMWANNLLQMFFQGILYKYHLYFIAAIIIIFIITVLNDDECKSEEPTEVNFSSLFSSPQVARKKYCRFKI